MRDKEKIRVPRILEGWAGRRYEEVVRDGRRIFLDSNLLDETREITRKDLGLVHQFHDIVSPANFKPPWRSMDEQESRRGINDPSTFDNWEIPGGPREHIERSMDGAEILVREIQANLETADSKDEWIRQKIEELRKLNPLHAAVAAGFHDEGREITHIYFTTELVGGSLLNKIGIRKDIRAVLPAERFLLMPLERDMNGAVRALPAEEVVLRIVDEFAKRKPNTNRLLQPEDFNPVQQEEWAARYVKKPLSGVASDRWIRKRMWLHNKNAARYLDALNNWLLEITGKSLTYYARILHRKLTPGLRPLSEKIPLTSNDLVDGETSRGEIRIGDRTIEIAALTHIGSMPKKSNEDGCSVITDGTSAQFYVVDGGTQMRPVATLKDISGGKYVAEKSVEFSKLLSPKNDLRTNLKELNEEIMRDVAINHDDIVYGENTENVPYGSIAAVRISSEKDVLEIANAGDIFVVVINTEGKARRITVDDIYEHDQKTFAVARELARKHGVTIRYAIEHRDIDEGFYGITEQMLKHGKILNIGGEKRILGGNAPNFDVTHAETLSLEFAKEIFIFSDGAVPAGIDIHKEEGLNEFVQLIGEVGVEGLYSKIEEAAAADPDFEKSPRFRNIDDVTMMRLRIK